jgi:parallel beta-helix repeat protein
MRRKGWSASLFAAAMLAFAASAGAVDGTIEINQAKVLAAGGFPYVISNIGSYRLTGNLAVSSTSADAIDVKSNHVTIDLNGFSIVGPGSSSTGKGIAGFTANALTVENGTITGFQAGVVIGTDGIVKFAHVDANGNGIVAGANAVIQGCTANGNTNGLGIQVAGEAVVSGNTASANSTGISCDASGCLVSGNTVDNNTGAPLSFLDSTSGYGGNVLNGNASAISGGTSLGHNLCNGVVC